MVCLGFEPGTAGWKMQTNPLSYDGPYLHFFLFVHKQNISQLFYVYVYKSYHINFIFSSAISQS